MPKGVPRDQSTKRKILHRLKIARGHLTKVIAMVESDEYCIDVVHQSQALQSALRKSDELILEYHLSNCVYKSRVEDKTATVKEVMEVIKKRR